MIRKEGSLSYKKIMLSSPMAGKSDEEIADERKDMMKLLEKSCPDHEYIIMNTFIPDHESKTDLECFAESVKFLSQADILVMGKSWAAARGCRLEHDIAQAYGLPIRYL